MTLPIDVSLPAFETDPGTPITPPPEPPPTPAPEWKPKRTRKRSEKPIEPPAAPLVVTDSDKKAFADLLTTAFGVSFALIASRRGQHWNLAREEAQSLGVAWAEPLAPLLIRYSGAAPWIVAALATVGVVSSRVAQDSAIEERRQQTRVETTEIYTPPQTSNRNPNADA